MNYDRIWTTGQQLVQINLQWVFERFLYGQRFTKSSKKPNSRISLLQNVFKKICRKYNSDSN